MLLNLSKSHRGSTAKRPATYRPLIEELERRDVPATTFYQPVNLVSDLPGMARIQDTSLVNAWGISLPPTGGNFWISDNATGLASVYFADVNGAPIQRNNLVVNLPGGEPTGQVFNGTTDFVVSDGAGHSGPAAFIFASESGSITGWNPAVPPPPPSRQAQVGVTVDGASFFGIALANNGSGNFLYAADFHNAKIDVFDAAFHQTAMTGTFTDPNIPAGFAPFNIQNLGGTLYVTYAQQDEDAEDEVTGAGLGFVDAFDTNGNFLRRVASRGALNAPWGLALAPANFGPASNMLLVGNFGDGKINVFNPNTGAFKGALSTGPGRPIVIDGLWGLTFGNGVSSGASNTLYFTAGPEDETHGLFGKIVMGTNVNDQLRRVQLEAIHTLRHSSVVTATVDIKNGKSTLNGPLTLFISDVPEGVTLLNATGRTPEGFFITVPTSQLKKNGHLQVRLVFDNAAGATLRSFRSIQMDVFAGNSNL